MLAAYARRLDIFKFFVSVCPIFPNTLSLSSETVQNDLNMLTDRLPTNQSINRDQSINQSIYQRRAVFKSHLV